MASLDPDFLARQPISPRPLRTVREIGERKGRQDLFRGRTPQVLETLRQATIIWRCV